MNPLTSITGSIIVGVVIALAITFAILPNGFNELTLARWLHILSGVMWIGLLYYFNVVQTPAWRSRPPTRAVRAAPASTSTSRPAPCSGSAGRAVATWLTGFWYLAYRGAFMSALTLGQRR